MSSFTVGSCVVFFSVLTPLCAADSLDKAAIYMERNVTDSDAEVVIRASADAGVKVLTVVGPDGRTLVEFKSPDSRLGIRSFSLESPEPKDDEGLRADFPQGIYHYTATSMAGASLKGSARLNHETPIGSSLVVPRDGQADVPVNGLKVQWTPVAGVEKYVIILEDEDRDLELEAEVSAAVTSFNVPEGYLNPGTEYKLAVGTVAPSGGRTFVEIAFSTAKTK